MKQCLFFFLCCLLLVPVSCARHPGPVEGMPGHHTTDGYRNYPVTAPEPLKGVFFNARRIRDYFSPPAVPRDHSLDEQQALIEYHDLEHENTLTWLGHSTFLIKINGKTILTDPFLTDIASSFIVGPRRYVSPGITIAHLPAIDLIVVSHNHYDHLDAETVEQLTGKEAIAVFVPLGLKSFFIERGYANVTELDWNQTAAAGDIRVEALPAVHNSGRKAFRRDWNETLWCSWAISFDSGRIYFAGDTAYSPGIYKEIGDKFRSFDLAIVPIGAYLPKELLSMSHTNPEEAVDVGADINAKTLVAMHWGTIRLSDEPPFEPKERFLDAAIKKGYSPERVWVMKIGETRRLPGSVLAP